MSEWISVKDRLPEKETRWNYDDSSVRVLVVDKDGYIFSGYYLYDCKHEWRAWRDDEVMAREATHWMPLPEPPKELS